MDERQYASYRKKLYYLIGGLFIFKLILAFTLELGNDEAYYWLYNKKLYWNYFDHPPLVAVWTRLFTLGGLLPDTEGCLRIGSVIASSLATFFMYQTVTALHSPRAGFFAACLYNASFYAGLTAGLYLMPDAPQMVFWTFSMWMLARITLKEGNRVAWILFGLAAGLCIMSKVHGVFLWIGLGSYALFYRRKWLTKPDIYIAALITLAVASPILAWNLEYDFATFKFHSKRVTIEETSLEFNFLKELLAQFYFNNPFNFVLACWGLFALWRRKHMRSPALTIFNFSGLPLAGLLLLISFFRDTTLPHWSGPAFVALIPLCAVQLASVSKKRYLPVAARFALGAFIAVLLGWTGMVHFYPGTSGSGNREEFGKGDISLDLFGWTEAAGQFHQLYQKEVSLGLMPPGTPLVCTYWWGAHVEYYFGRPFGITMLGLGPMKEVRHYLWMNARSPQANFDSAYCIMPADENYALPQAFYQHIKLITTITIPRGGKPAHLFRVYRLTGYKGTWPKSR